MPKPLIGLTPAYDEAAKRYQLGREYFEAVTAAGAVPLLLEMTENAAQQAEYLTLCDGFIFTGGCDIDPQFYGRSKSPYCDVTMPKRDRFELALFRQAFAQAKPILAICRGHQLANVALGGTLYQHLPAERPSEIAHRQPEPFDTLWHEVVLAADTPLRRLLGEVLQVNSFHHQAIAQLGHGLVAAAHSADGIVEAITAPEHNRFLGVQWHPERLFPLDGASLKLFRQLASWAAK